MEKANKDLNHHIEEAKWYAVYTKYKAEKWVTEKLKAKDIVAYTPLIQLKKKYSKRIATHYYPIISCYVFVKINPCQQLSVLQTEHVYDFVKISNKPIPIPQNEIDVLKRIAGENIETEKRVEPYHVGRKVEIIAGNLTGIKGTLIDTLGKKEFVVELESLGYQLKINIDPALLMPCDQLVLTA